MSMGVGKTSYSILAQGGKGYINIGGWNTTLTDVATTAKETVGIVRQEGAGAFRYVQLGTAAVTSAGAYLSLSTAYTDVNGYIPVFALTANGTVSTGLICNGMTVGSSVSGTVYAWVFVSGFATGYAMTDSALAQGALVCPATSTANLLDTAATVTAGTAIGRVVGPTVATAVASAGGAGNLINYSFKPF